MKACIYLDTYVSIRRNSCKSYCSSSGEYRCREVWEEVSNRPAFYCKLLNIRGIVMLCQYYVNQQLKLI